MLGRNIGTEIILYEFPVPIYNIKYQIATRFPVISQEVELWMNDSFLKDSSLTRVNGIPFIIFDDVTLRVDDQLLFHHVNWSMESGRHWAVVGPNGSGKSVLAGAILGQTAVIDGRIRYFFDRADGSDGRSYFKRGEIIKIVPEDHRRMILQYGGYHQARWQSFESDGVATVADFLTGSSIERISPYEVTPLQTDEAVYRIRRDDTVELLGIKYLLERKILHLSNGELRKVLLARALMQSPRLLVLDDPFCGLDISSRATLAKAINQIIQAGSTQILLLTARMEEIPERITHILVVENHRVVAQKPNDPTNGPESAGPDGATGMSGGAPRFKPAVPFPFRQSEPASSAILVEMQNVTVTYDGTNVLSGIDWKVYQGERWVVLGHNGAGKSTLLSLILADNPQVYANKIKLFGKSVGAGNDIWEMKRLIGYVSPEFQVYYPGGWTCSEVICSGFFDSIGLYRDCSPEQTAQAELWLRYLGFTALSKKPFYTISAGEQRLIMLARALIKNPALLVLDEPCQGLDFKYRGRILSLLEELCRKTSAGVIYVTHHRDEIPQFITHQLKIEQGRITIEKRKG